MPFSDTTLIIPTFNEGKNIEQLLAAIRQQYPSMNIIVSDDGSTDGTREIATNTPGCTLLDRSGEPVHGLTVSVLDAIRLARTEFCVVMDGDGQHPYEKVGEMVEKLRGGADVVVGSRESIPNWRLERRIISMGATFLGRLALFVRGAPQCSDVMSGFFGVKRDLMSGYIESDYDAFVLEGYKVLFDLLKLLPSETVMDTVGYDFGERGGGESKIGWKHIRLYFWSLFG